MYRNGFKRIFDFLIALTVFVLLFPFFILFTIALFFANNGSVFFTQVRPGLNGKLFRLVKFKTMNDKKDSSGVLLPDSERLTGVGRIIRKLSIDELPQLLNVIMGDMALVGPRPLLEEYLPLYSKEQARRHNVRPGITGWAQVNGRNSISWSDKFKYDVYYVDNLSFALDIKIYFLTLFKLIKVEGISSETSVTMEKFTGN